MTLRSIYVRALWFCFLSFGFGGPAAGQQMLVPMDLSQSDHLRSYGLAFHALEKGYNVEWLLNYRGGSFVLPATGEFVRLARLRGVVFTPISSVDLSAIYAEVEAGNMERMTLEKAPIIAVYTPPENRPWDDAVTLALEYAEVPYTKLWDEEVLTGGLEKYDWLHLHHEDFTGQYSKFSMFYRMPWYKQQKGSAEDMARRMGYSSVPEEKKAVAQAIKGFVAQGGFLFAMCSATETLDIALSAENTDIVPSEYDYTPVDPDCQSKLDFGNTFAFENFTLQVNPSIGAFSDIDVNHVNAGKLPTGTFTLFDFSAKHDPVSSMLTQNHSSVISGFFGLTTSFNKRLLKQTVVVLAQEEGTDRVKYLHGNFGRGTFTFYGGHDPEDEDHRLNDPATNLVLYKNSPGYRLILNNVLFPAARHKNHKKT